MKKKIFNQNILFIILFIVLALYAVTLILPLGWGVMVSLMDQTQFELKPFAFPDICHFENYIKAFDLFKVTIAGTDANSATEVVYIETMLLNSILYCVGCAFFSTLAPCLVAYITAKYNFKFLKFINSFVIVAMILPIVGSAPSEMQIAKSLGLYNNIFGFWFMRFSFLGMYYLLFYATFKNLSWGYAEAAIIDGASNFTIMVKIMFPLISSTFGVIFLLFFISYWNDYTTPLLYLPSYPTIAVGLFKYYSSPGQESSLVPMQLTGCMMVMLPVLIIFIIFRNKIMGNVAIGGLKG